MRAAWTADIGDELDDCTLEGALDRMFWSSLNAKHHLIQFKILHWSRAKVSHNSPALDLIFLFPMFPISYPVFDVRLHLLPYTINFGPVLQWQNSETRFLNASQKYIKLILNHPHVLHSLGF